MNTFRLYFEDFKDLIKENRLFYYEGRDYFDFHFLIDGIVVKTTISKSQIENPKRFFSDKMFYNSKKLPFPIMDATKSDLIIVDGGKIPLEGEVDFVQEMIPEEIKSIDIQKQGSEE